MKNKKGQTILAGIIISIFIIVLIFLLNGYDTVDANHLGVMNNFGNIKGIMTPGMRWTGLFTAVYSYDMRLRKDTIELNAANAASDKTGQQVFATIHVNYRIKGGEAKEGQDIVMKLYQEVGTDDQIDNQLNVIPRITEGFKQATALYEATDIYQKRQEVKLLAEDNIRKNFPSDYLELVDVVVTNIDFTPEFKTAIEAKKVAAQTALKEQSQVDVVKFQQQQKIVEYQAQAEQMRLQKSQITPELISQQLINKWDGHLPEYLIMPPNGNTMLLNLAKGDVSTIANANSSIGGN